MGFQFARVVAAVGDVPERLIARASSEPFASATHATVIRFPTAAMLAYPWYPSTRSRRVVEPITSGTDQGPAPERSRKYTLPFVASTHAAYRLTGPNVVFAAAMLVPSALTTRPDSLLGFVQVMPSWLDVM